jgi:ubiquinone/menaquinone biosynthesis C-methylase UbiE
MHHTRTTRLFTIALLSIVAVIAFAHDSEEESVQIAELMELNPGTVVADVGAGDGNFGEMLARRVGESGHVYLTEIGQSELEKIRRRVEQSELTNMSVIEGETDETNLPEDCCDALLVRYVVHHMSRPDDMLSSLKRSLRQNGRLVIVEKNDPDDGIEADDLIDDLRRAGFDVLSRHPEWGGHDGHYAIVVQAP